MGREAHTPPVGQALLDRSDPSSGKFKCAVCGSGMRVIDTRATDGGNASVIRRRRVCILKSCRVRVTTYELQLPDGFELDHVLSVARLARDLGDLERAIQAAVGQFTVSMQTARRGLQGAKMSVIP